MKLRLVILTIFICCIRLLQSQPISFPAEKNMTSNEITPMTVGNDLKGYFATLLVEDLKKEDKSIYNLLIMDVNFKIIKDINFQHDYPYWPAAEVFNGKSFCLSYTNAALGEVRHLFMDDQGQKIGSLKLEDIHQSWLYPNYTNQLSAVPYAGYLKTGPFPKGESPNVEMLDNAGKRMWRLDNKEVTFGKTKRFESIKYFHGDSNFIVVNVSFDDVKPQDLGDKTDNFLRVHDTKTGKVLFEVNHRHEKGFLVPMRLQFDQGEMIVFGQFFEYTKAVASYPSKSLGFYSQRYDRNGKIVTENFSLWKDELSKYLEIDEKDQVEGDRALWFHDIIRTADGKYFVIGEFFNKGFNTVVFNTGNVFVRDIIAMELDASLSLTKVHRFEKTPSRHDIILPGYLGNYHFGNALVLNKLFDYQFTTQSPDHTMFTSVYDSYDKSGPGKKKFVIGAIGYNQDGEIVNPKITLTSDPDAITLIRAKTGYVAIIESYTKQKMATLTLYKFDL